MDSIAFSSVKANLAVTMDRVCKDHEPVIIKRRGGESVVMMSLKDYESMEETAYLLRSPNNAKKILEAVEQLESGEGKKRKLLR